jgi:hypothetical protein
MRLIRSDPLRFFNGIRKGHYVDIVGVFNALTVSATMLTFTAVPVWWRVSPAPRKVIA